MERIRSAEPFAVTFYENRHRPLNVRIALAAKESARSCQCSIDPETYIGTVDSAKPHGMYYVYYYGVHVEEQLFSEHMEESPECAPLFREVYDYVKDYDSQEHMNLNRNPQHQRLCDSGAGWAGGWIGHANPDYDLLLHEGTDGLRKRIAKYRATNPERSEFYEACELYLDAVDILGDRLHDMAMDCAEKSCDENARREYLRTADAYRVIPRKPACDMHTAVLLFWLVFSYDGVDSPGRLDQFFLDYWRRSEPNDAMLQLDRLWQHFHRTRTWNLCISGSDEHWSDVSNEITYAVLDLAEKYRYQTPNITLRLHRNSPEKLWRRAVEVIATGIGMPALYNDEAVCPALEKMGIPPEHSHLYCMNGCNQIDIMGKSHMGLEDGDVNFGKCLEYALHDGIDTISGKQVSIHTGDAASFDSFQKLLDAFKRQLEHVTSIICEIANSSQMSYAEYAPSPLRSCLIEGCLEKGMDYKNGGPLYGDGQILSFGMPETADSLAAIKKYVFEEKRYTMKELVSALKADFCGFEEMKAVLTNGPKFGNDDPYVDDIMKDITDHWFAYLKTIYTFRGGRYGGGCSTFVCAPNMGRATGTLPCGHLSQDPSYSDSINAVPGQDRHGPTAAVKSTLVYDHTEVISGFVFQLRFDKKLFATENGMNSFLDLAKAYFKNGGQQMSINVLSHEELLEAQKHPENYRDLVVRVGGYSDYFVNISADLQNNIIARTSHST